MIIQRACLQKVRVICLEVFCKKSVLKNLPNSGICARVSFLIKLQASACNFIKRETLAQVLFCEFCEIFKNLFFTELLRWLLLKSYAQKMMFVLLGTCLITLQILIFFTYLIICTSNHIFKREIWDKFQKVNEVNFPQITRINM